MDKDPEKMYVVRDVRDKRFPVEYKLAVSRLEVENDEVECMYQLDGVTQIFDIQHQNLIKMLEIAGVIEESGFFAQRANFGLHIHVITDKYGPGLLFIKTKPEFRVPDAEIAEREKVRAAELEKNVAENFGKIKEAVNQIAAKQTADAANLMAKGKVQ